MRLFVALLLACLFGLAQAGELARSDLPPEGREVMSLIEAGGPFPYRRDGIIFGNFERQLPPERRGYYR